MGLDGSHFRTGFVHFNAPYSVFRCDCKCTAGSLKCTQGITLIQMDGIISHNQDIISVSKKQEMSAQFISLSPMILPSLKWQHNQHRTLQTARYQHICLVFFRWVRVKLPSQKRSWVQSDGNDRTFGAREHHRARIQRLLFATLITIFNGAHIEGELTVK